MNLTPQQLNVMFHLDKGHTYKEVAREMGLSPRTVEYYVSEIKNRTGLSSRFELLSYYRTVIQPTLETKEPTND